MRSIFLWVYNVCIPWLTKELDSTPANAGDTGSILCLRRSHTSQSSYACVPQLRASTLEPGSCNCWAHMGQLLKPVHPGEAAASEEHGHCNWSIAPTCWTWRKDQAAMNTHPSQKKWIHQCMKNHRYIYLKKRERGWILEEATVYGITSE